MARWLTKPLCLALLLSGCATAGQQAARAPSLNERLRLAAAAEANNNHEVALSIYRNAAQAEPDNAEVQARFARALTNRGLHAEAMLVLEQALARRPRDRTLLLALGRTQLRANDLRTAEQSFNRLLEQAPGDPDALNGLGVIADISGEHALAQQRYREGLRRAPAHEGLRNNIALSLALTGATGEAKEMLERLRRDGNTDVRVRHNLALVYAMAGDEASARRLVAAELDAVEQQQLVTAASLLAAAGRSTPPTVPGPRPESVAPPPSGTPAAAAIAPAPQAAAPASPASVAPALAAPSRVVLAARSETWVQVHERAGGGVPFDRVMQPGETYHVPDRPGLLLTTGNAGGLAVQVAGETLPPLGADRAVRRNLPLDPADLRPAVVAGVR